MNCQQGSTASQCRSNRRDSRQLTSSHTLSPDGSPAQNSTAQNSTAQNRTAQHSPAQPSTEQLSPAQNRTAHVHRFKLTPTTMHKIKVSLLWVQHSGGALCFNALCGHTSHTAMAKRSSSGTLQFNVLFLQITIRISEKTVIK